MAENSRNNEFFERESIAIIADLNVFVKEGVASPHPVKISALQEETVCDYLNWLIRELLLNAIIHRDYQIGNAVVSGILRTFLFD